MIARTSGQPDERFETSAGRPDDAPDQAPVVRRSRRTSDPDRLPPGQPRACKDCAVETGSRSRPCPYPGPRCATHWRRKKKAGQLASWAKRLAARFGLTPDEWTAIYEAQGGTCYVCGKTRGTTKRLAVEHDHGSGLIRGLACGPCNWLLAKLGDDPARFRAIADALEHPPAVAAIGERYAPATERTTDAELETTP